MNARVAPPQPAALPTLVLIHDVASVTREFELLVPILAARSVSFDCIEIPGYTSGRDRPTGDWRRWLATAGTSLDRRYPAGASVVLAGFGAGAALAAALAIGPRPQRVGGVAMLSPSFATDESPGPRRLAPRVAAMLGLDRRMMVPRLEPLGIRNPKTRKGIVRDLEECGMSAIGPARMSLRARRESERLHAHVRGSLASLAMPVLILQAADDAPALEYSERMVAAIGASARLIALEHSERRITVDNDRQRVAHELADFLGAPKRVPTTAAPATRQRSAVASV
jgi:pimeloyl-ACP methyl ester carboxylesterase